MIKICTGFGLPSPPAAGRLTVIIGSFSWHRLKLIMKNTLPLRTRSYYLRSLLVNGINGSLVFVRIRMQRHLRFHSLRITYRALRTQRTPVILLLHGLIRTIERPIRTRDTAMKSPLMAYRIRHRPTSLVGQRVKIRMAICLLNEIIFTIATKRTKQDSTS